MEAPLTRQARLRPGALAVVAPGEALTYAELEEGAARTARRLAARGVGEGDRVASTLEAGLAFAALVHGCALLGAALAPLNTREPRAEQRRQAEAAGARLVVEEPLEGPEADVALRGEVEPDAVHTVLFTSGTSGTARPVELTHANHRASALASAWNLGAAPDDRWLCVLPVFHVGGLAILLRSAWYGTAVDLRTGFDVESTAAALAGGDVTLVSLVPTMLRRLAAAGLEHAPRLRAALLGGGPVPRELLRWASENGFPALQTYGMTETASQIATLSAAEALTHEGSAGRPLPGAELRIGAEGEILARGPMVARGALASDGWLHTGDRGRLGPDGLLWVDGRLKDVIVTGGENVSVVEVEQALESHPAVREAAVTGRPDAEWGETVVAWVVLETDVADPELLAHLRERVAGFKLPREIHRTAELPRTASGKLRRAPLEVPASQDGARGPA